MTKCCSLIGYRPNGRYWLLNTRYTSDKYEPKTRFEEVPDDEDPEIFDERQRIKSIINQNEALRSRINLDMTLSKNQEKTPEIREAAKKDWKKIK